MDNDEWILEAGEQVILAEETRALSDLERFVYMLWVLDYAVRNAGSTAKTMRYANFRNENGFRIINISTLEDNTPLNAKRPPNKYCKSNHFDRSMNSSIANIPRRAQEQ